MSWAIKYIDDLNVIELTFSGLVSPAELKEAFNAAVSLSREKGTQKFFADCTDMAGGHSVIDLYLLISLFEDSGLRKMKEAVLLPSLKSSKKEVSFYETACLNRGFNVKIFGNPQDALEWLTT